MKKNKLQIRNSTAEFLIFTSQVGEDSIEVTVVDENVWLTQDMIEILYGKEYNTKFYSLEAAISVGFRTNSEKAIVFRKWATSILIDFSIRGYVVDKERLKNGSFLNEEYFAHLLEEIREIRASERKFYQKITDIYATAMDYSSDSKLTRKFFETVQNKLRFR